MSPQHPFLIHALPKDRGCSQAPSGVGLSRLLRDDSPASCTPTAHSNDDATCKGSTRLRATSQKFGRVEGSSGCFQSEGETSARHPSRSVQGPQGEQQDGRPPPGCTPRAQVPTLHAAQILRRNLPVIKAATSSSRIFLRTIISI